MGICLAGALAFLPSWASVLVGGVLTAEGSIGLCGSGAALGLLAHDLWRWRRGVNTGDDT